MARILVNYNYNKKKDVYTLLDSDCVFADLPVAILDSDQEIVEPLVVPIQGSMTVVEKGVYTLKNKKFYLALDDMGNVIEDTNGSEVWLPKDTNVSQLMYINGQLVLASEDRKEAEPHEDND